VVRPARPRAGAAWRTKQSLLATNHALKSPSRRAGDQSDEKNVIVRGALQLVRELLPNAARFGVLADPANVDIQFFIADLEVAARTPGLQLVVVNASADSDLEPAFATFSQQHVGAVLVGHSAFYSRRMEQLAALAARHALPAIYTLREYALAGGLISYGSGQGYFYHQLGIYAGRILKGEKLTDLSVQRITKTDLVINLKTAKALGLTIPETLLATADEVIQ
jgi:putative ABC transport system substrate-binding protein